MRQTRVAAGRLAKRLTAARFCAVEPAFSLQYVTLKLDAADMSDQRINLEDRAKSRRVGVLGQLWPFMRPYTAMV